MLVQQQVHREGWELMKWILLLALAGALTLVFLSGIAAAKERIAKEPAALPAEIQEWAVPMNVAETTPPMGLDVAMQVWRAIDAQFHEKFAEAIGLWKGIDMPRDTEVWKHVALGQAYLAKGQWEPARDELLLAARLEPENPVVRYFLGVFYLEKVFHLEEWNWQGGGVATFVAHGPPELFPMTPGLCQLQAIVELENAIELAPNLNLYAALVPEDWPTDAAAPPTVRDLLLATGADNYVAKAHNLLGDVHLHRGALEVAEQHMDQAAAGGLKVVHGYTGLANQYEEAGRHADAMRANLKAAQHEANKVGPLRKAWRNMWDAIL